VAAPSIARPDLFRPPLDYPRVPYDRLLADTARRAPENVALVCGDVSLTFRELEALTNRFARALTRLGVRRGDRVCLLTPNCPEYVVAFYAIARVGAVVSPMNPSYREREIEYQLRDTDAVALIGHRSLLPLVEAVRPRAPALEHVIAIGDAAAGAAAAHGFTALIATESPAPPPAAGVGADDLVALPYSSGTTGLPKGVMLSHRNLVTNNVQFVATVRLGEVDRLMLFLPLYHIYGAMLMGGAVLAGATCVLMERFEPGACLQLVERHRVTCFFAVPPVLLVLADWPRLREHDFSSVRFTLVGAAPVPPELSRRFSALTGAPVLQGYGMTEASPITHLNPVHDPSLIALDSAGLPVHDTEQKVVDLETGERTLAPGEVGEICIRGPQIMQGYWRAPDATAAALRDGWYHSGDIGYVDERGYVVIQDRKKEMIKYKGLGIAPAEIEALLLEHPAIADAAVIGVPHPEAGEVPKAFVVRRAGHAALDADAVAGFVRTRLASYKTPGMVEFLEAIPRTPSGKILRRVLKERERPAS
jgi:long-chain acyl-CoA synthetase